VPPTPLLVRIFVSREACALRVWLICKPVWPRLPTFEFETDTRLVFSWLQFGDIGAPTCVVGEWSAWSACSTLGIQQATTGAAQAAFKSRTRTVLSGAGSGCPDLQQIAQCGEQLECSFVLVVCVPGGGGGCFLYRNIGLTAILCRTLDVTSFAGPGIACNATSLTGCHAMTPACSHRLRVGCHSLASDPVRYQAYLHQRAPAAAPC
jgi:hypothetical protein